MLMIDAGEKLSLAGAQSRKASRKVLNTGSGPVSSSSLHRAFASRDWEEVRLDIDPNVKPDLLGSVGNMRQLIKDATFDAIWSSHNIEHLHAFEVVPALRECRRILKPDGFVFVTCPDIEAICWQVIKKGLDAVAYPSPAGPVTALDMLFGHGYSIAKGNKYMCHHSGFTEQTLGDVALSAGFAEARIGKGNNFDLWGVFLLPQTDRSALSRLLAPTHEAFLVA